MQILEGDLKVSDKKFAVIMSKFNLSISKQLLEGTLDTFRKQGVKEENITVVKVPGAYEIPLTADKAASSGKFDAVVCIGAVIRGATPHFDFVASAASEGILKVNLKYGVPVIFGVLTTDNVEQAIERASIKAGNKGGDCALAAIEMANVLKMI